MEIFPFDKCVVGIFKSTIIINSVRIYVLVSCVIIYFRYYLLFLCDFVFILYLYKYLFNFFFTYPSSLDVAMYCVRCRRTKTKSLARHSVFVYIYLAVLHYTRNNVHVVLRISFFFCRCVLAVVTCFLFSRRTRVRSRDAGGCRTHLFSRTHDA